MSDELKSLFVTLKANTDNFVAGMNDADKRLGSWQKSVEKAGKNLQQLGQKMFVAGSAIVGGLGLMVGSYAKTGEEIEQMKAKTGMGAESLSELKYVLDQVGGTFSNLPASIRAMNLAISSAATGAAPFNQAIMDAAKSGDSLKLSLAQAAAGAAWAKTPFGQLGISLEALKGMTPEQQFNTLTTALQGVTDESMQAMVAQGIFGKSATDLMPLIEEEKGKVTELKEEARKLNVTFTDDSAAAASAFEGAKTKLTAAFDGLKASIADSVMPKMTEFFNMAGNIVTRITDWAKANPELADSLLKVGAVLVVGGALLMGLAQLSKAITAISTALIILQGLSGPKGWITLGIGIAAAAASIIAVNKLMSGVEQSSRKAEMDKLQRDYEAGKITFNDYMDRMTALLPSSPSTPPKGYAFGGIIPGPIGAPVPIIAHGGERFLGKDGNSVAGGGIVINVGTWLGDDAGIRKLARMVKRYEAEDNRRSFFGHLQSGYGSGTSAV